MQIRNLTKMSLRNQDSKYLDAIIIRKIFIILFILLGITSLNLLFNVSWSSNFVSAVTRKVQDPIEENNTSNNIQTTLKSKTYKLNSRTTKYTELR